LLTGGLAHLGELDRQRPKRRRAPAHDVLEGIGEFLVAIPLPLAQPIDEPVDRVRIARRSPWRIEPDIVTHVHLRARRYEAGRPGLARSLARTLPSGQSAYMCGFAIARTGS
jgi:hypothetical protein